MHFESRSQFCNSTISKLLNFAQRRLSIDNCVVFSCGEFSFHISHSISAARNIICMQIRLDMRLAFTRAFYLSCVILIWRVYSRMHFPYVLCVYVQINYLRFFSPIYRRLFGKRKCLRNKSLCWQFMENDRLRWLFICDPVLRHKLTNG